MLDPQLLRNQIDEVVNGLARRGVELDVGAFRELEGERKRLQVQTEALRGRRNTESKAIGKAKAAGEDIEPRKQAIADLGDELKTCEMELEAVQVKMDAFGLGLPNLPHPSVPDGEDESANEEQRRWGEIPRFDFTPRDHVDLGASQGGMDFELGVKIAGSRFVVLSGSLARLQRGLIQFMLDVHTTEHGYTEVYVPFMANADSMRGTGQLPKFEEDLFAIPEYGFYLIPTAEVPVTNMARNEILEPDSMPRRYVCHTPCFRSEAGSYGKDTRGMIRQHQFEKVEMVQLVRPKDSYDALETLTGHAETILRRLELPYRVVNLCTGDLGFSAAKTYDLEVWLPSQERYREISSCSNFESFQARRMLARWRNPVTGKPELLHTLNGSGVAVGRALIAIMENYQRADGSIAIPQVLQPYLGGLKEIPTQEKS